MRNREGWEKGVQCVHSHRALSTLSWRKQAPNMMPHPTPGFDPPAEVESPRNTRTFVVLTEIPFKMREHRVSITATLASPRETLPKEKKQQACAL